MRKLFAILTLSFLVLGCQRPSRASLVIEDATPIVGAGRTTEAFGIETLGGVFTPLIKVGTPVPCSLSEVFSTAADGQSEITVKPFRGTNQLVAGNRALGQYQIVGIPAAPRGAPQVEVTFTITKRQILISARDLTGKAELQIQRVSAHTKTMTTNEGRQVLESPIGIVTLGSQFTELIPAGGRLPLTFSDVFANAEDGQKAIEVTLSQKHRDGVEIIATIVADNLPARPKGTLRVIVNLSISTMKEMKVKVTVTETGLVKDYGPFPVR